MPQIVQSLLLGKHSSNLIYSRFHHQLWAKAKQLMNTAADLLGRPDLANRQVSLADEAQKLLQDKAPKSNDRKMKKPKGMKREVFDLINNPEEPPTYLLQESGTPGFKSKRSVAEGKWVWSQIENSARSDGMKSLGHWVRADKFYADYPYAQFNVKTEPLRFSAELYDSHLQDPLWTREDTDRLLACCHAYSLRWPVVCDRLVLSAPKSLEQCQARYYAIFDTLQRVQQLPATFSTATASSSSSSAAGVAAAAASFHLDTETVRRSRQDRLYHLPKEAESHEQKLREELRTINEELKKIKKTLKVSSASSATSGAAAARIAAAQAAETSSMTSASAASPAVMSSSAAAAVGAPTALSPAQTALKAQIEPYLATGALLLDATVTNPLQPVVAPAPPPSTSSSSSAAPPPAPAPAITAQTVKLLTRAAPVPGFPALQSQRLFVAPNASAGLSKTALQKSHQLLRELQVPERPMPTRRVCDLLDLVRRDAQSLVALHNQLRKKEVDLQHAKEGQFKSVSAQGGGRGSGDNAVGRALSLATKTEKAPRQRPANSKAAAAAAAAAAVSAAANGGNVVPGQVPGTMQRAGSAQQPQSALYQPTQSMQHGFVVKEEPGHNQYQQGMPMQYAAPVDPHAQQQQLQQPPDKAPTRKRARGNG